MARVQGWKAIREALQKAIHEFVQAGVLVCFVAIAGRSPATDDALFVVSDYDSGHVYWVSEGTKHPIHGMREAWVFNRALEWLEPEGEDGTLLCLPVKAPLELTGREQVSRWFAGPGARLEDLERGFTRFVKGPTGGGSDHASLPPFQFPIEAFPSAALEVEEVSGAWRLAVLIKGRSGPPLHTSAWQLGPGSIRIPLLELYRARGYRGHWAEMQFALFVRDAGPDTAGSALIRLHLEERPAVIPSLPIVRTIERASTEGVPVAVAVVGFGAKRLTRGEVQVNARTGGRSIALEATDGGPWLGRIHGLAAGEHRVEIEALGPSGVTIARTTIEARVASGGFIAYDPKLRLLSVDGKPLGPLTGSYRGAPMFRDIGTPAERLVQGQAEWDAVKGTRHEGQYQNHGSSDASYGFHFWESLTERELDADHAYLERCGWTLLHLCQGWWVWERLDAGGHLAPHGAERLAAVLASAARHGLRVHLAVSHYPLGRESAPWAQYLEAGYGREDYTRKDARFRGSFRAYLRDLAAVFRDDTALSSYTAAGEGDADCGKDFVNDVHDTLRRFDAHHIVLCEPHLNPRPYPRDMNYYLREGWKPLLGGMRTYPIDRDSFEHIAVEFKLAGMGHIFLGEGVFWGFNEGATRTEDYRVRIRQEFYTGLPYRLPIQLSWEERVTEDERIVFERVRRAVDWRKPFAHPKLIVRFGSELDGLVRLERALSRLPLEYAFVTAEEPLPPGTLHEIDARAPLEDPSFVSEGGRIPDELSATRPLLLPDGFVASYSTSEDHLTLLAYIQEPEPWARRSGAATTEAGNHSYIDTTRVIERDLAIASWEVDCVEPGTIRLQVYRESGGHLECLGESRLETMVRPGRVRFRVDPPIEAKRGNWIGFRIPDETTHIAAETGGHMLWMVGEPPGRRTAVEDWSIEPKRASIAVSEKVETEGSERLGSGDSGEREIRGEGKRETRGEGKLEIGGSGNTGEAQESEAGKRLGEDTRPSPRLVQLRNFPQVPLEAIVFDLEEKRAVYEGRFSESAAIDLPKVGRHFFILVTEAK